MIRDGLPAGDYYIIVDGQTAAATGAFRLEVNWTGNDIEGDRCGQPHEWPPGTAELCSDTDAVSHEYTGSCGGGDRDRLYYFVVPPGDPQEYSFSTCDADTDFNTVLYVRSACQNSTSQIACSNDLGGWCSTNGGASAISSLFDPDLAPGIYYVFVDGHGQHGDFCLNYATW